MRPQSQKLNNFALGVDIGATNLRLAFVDEDGKIKRYKKLPTPQRDVVNSLKHEVKTFLNENNDLCIKAIGLSVAGTVKGKTARLGNVTDKPEISVEDFSDFSKSIIFVNDTSAAAFAEYLKYNKNIYFITISTGIGGSIVTTNSNEVCIENIEPGHKEVQTVFNMVCGCGKNNHWEAYCSGKNIVSFYKEWAKLNNKPNDFRTAQEIFEAAKHSSFVMDFITEINRINADSIAKIIKGYEIPEVVLSGSVVLYNQEIIINYLKNQFPKIGFTASDFGDEISVIGAALLALNPSKRKFSIK